MQEHREHTITQSHRTVLPSGQTTHHHLWNPSVPAKVIFQACTFIQKANISIYKLIGTHDSLLQQTGPSTVAGLSPSLFLRLQTALKWAGHQRADAEDAKSCRLCRDSELAVLLLSLCRQPLSQDATHTGTFYSKQVYSRSHWLANCTCTTNYLNIT